MTKWLANFGLTEALMSVTILALIALLLVVSVGETGKKERDAQRKIDVKMFFAAAEQFKTDYGVYPAYSTRLGINVAESDKSLNYDVATTLTICEQGSFKPDGFAVKDDLITPTTDYNQAYLKPGFNAVSQFLNCLGYTHQTASDPIAAGTVYDYQYRVSSGGGQMVAAATLERLNDSDLATLINDALLPQYYVGNGTSQRALDDDSDTGNGGGYFQAFIGRKTANGQYLYQCLQSVDKKALTLAERLSVDYQPFVSNNGSSAPNPKCLDSLEGLLVVGAN